MWCLDNPSCGSDPFGGRKSPFGSRKSPGFPWLLEDLAGAPSCGSVGASSMLTSVVRAFIMTHVRAAILLSEFSELDVGD